MKNCVIIIMKKKGVVNVLACEGQFEKIVFTKATPAFVYFYGLKTIEHYCKN